MAQAPRKFSIADVLGFGTIPKRDMTQGYRREVGKIKRGDKLQGSIARARPSASQELGQLLTPNTRFGNELAAKIAGAVDYSPLSVLTGFVDARRAYNAGNLGTAASTGLLAALGAIPGGKGAKVAKEAAEEAAGRGIIAYHGSPHSFDRFDITKIGTGEGAQAYGHGLYFAEAEDVAKNYRDRLARPEPGDMVGNAYDLVKVLGEEEALKNLKDIPGKAAADTIKAIESGAYKKWKPKGSMYEVRINADPKDFIDWDAALSNQNEKVRAVLGESDLLAAADRLSLAKRNPMFAGDILKIDRATPAELSRGFLQMGIPGVKYKDAFSRGGGKETSNYVVFDDALVEILKKYGIAIPAIAGGGLLATQPQQDGGI